MKKIILICGMLLMLCGCGKYNVDDALKEFKKDVTSSKSYKLTGTMEIMNDEESFVYDLESYYLKDNYYKVILVNQTNNHEQVILKNSEDVYVITPELNKSFKFQSEWPNNSSQAYLLDSLLKDLENDKNPKLIEEDNKYVIKSTINYPNNEELSYQKLYFSKGMKIEKVEVFDKNDIVKIKVMFDEVDMKANLSKKDFTIEEYIDESSEEDCVNNECNEETKQNPEKSNTSENQAEQSPETNSNTKSNTTTPSNEEQTPQNNSTQNSQTSGLNLDSVIYPLYIPGETYLSSSETIKTEDGNRVILTFTGEKNFVIIEELATSKPTMEVVPVYGDPLMLSNSIGALSANSLTWDANNISYYLASTDLSTKEMLTIANSLGNSTLVSGEK